LIGKFRNILIFGISVLIFVVILQKLNEEKSELRDLEMELFSIHKDGLILQDQRDRWENKILKEKQLDRVRNFSTKPEIKKRGDKILFRFEEPMTKKEFESLTRTVLRSTIPIERIVIEKVDEFSAVLSVEVEK
jgi:hypothetical protein